MDEALRELIDRYGHRYVYRDLPLLCREVALKLLDLGDGECSKLSTDLGFSESVVCRVGDWFSFGRSLISMEVARDVASSGSDSVYAVFDGDVVEVATYVSGQGFCKLRYLGLGIPTTVEINGIHMHRIAGIDPYRDAELKVRSLGRVRGLVLDTCMGLGYTAIKALELGASQVITVEVSEAIIAIAELNPWSRKLGDPRITVLKADIAKVIHEMPSETFDAAIHDPPRISVAGELYSLEMYRELYRVLKPGAKLFHYTGEPGKHGGPSYLKGIRNRLERAGFVDIRWVDRALGFVARKPR